MPYPEFEKLVDVVNALRDPETGCPWDLEQTHQSLLPYMIEEAYEFLHAAENNDDSLMEEELGDVLLQILLHSRLGFERNAFNLDSVAKVLAEKLIRRHPHVFANNVDERISPEQVSKNWDEIKKNEKSNKGFHHRIDGTYLKFPALFSAHKIGVRTEKLNFDWENPSQVAYKVEEEWQELKEELKPGLTPNAAAIREELGDFLFSIAQLARHLDIDPEEALREANKKFIRRFNQVELLIDADGLKVEDMKQNDMDRYWGMAKSKEKNEA